MLYNANFHYFDKIDNSNKAYWLGFIWADGYIAKRIRLQQNNSTRIEYNLKIALMEEDKTHLEKFVKDINGNYPIHKYKMSSKQSYISDAYESRLFITNKYMCQYLYEELGIKPRRNDASLVIEKIPKEFHKDFILGLFDADGSMSVYQGDYGKKLVVTFGGSEQLLRFIEKHLDENVLHSGTTHKLYQRHKDKDGDWVTLSYAGVPQGMKILNYLYDNPNVCLDRKFEKYKKIPY